VRLDVALPQPSDTERHVLRGLPHGEIWRYLNLQMLYGKHLGAKGNVELKLRERDPRFVELTEVIDEVKKLCGTGLMQIDVLYQFFAAEAEGNRLTLFHPDGQVGAQFDFPRQGRSPNLCLADYVLPAREGQRDHVAAFVTTAGGGIREQAEAWKASGEYLRCHVLQALALETAEAAAEWIHRRIRSAWGIGDALELSMDDLHRAQYQGRRYSFGYPACPELGDQAQLFRLLQPEQIGVQLTDGFMMEPEASVSAIVFHHPDARYFSIG
jgi:5-methyltetrahydrofolate--homocysteine methyltransferase